MAQKAIAAHAPAAGEGEHDAHVRELVKAAHKAMEQIQLEFHDEAYETLDAALSHFEKGV